MKGSGFQRSKKQINGLRHGIPSETSAKASRLLTEVPDKRVRRRLIDWYFRKDKILFYFALSMLGGLTIFSILIIVGEYHLYVKASCAVSLTYLIRRLTTHLLKYV
jgi:hypothetical protein